MSNKILEWIKVVGPIIVSWPMVALLVVILFKALEWGRAALIS
jgi:hypothetical protein